MIHIFLLIGHLLLGQQAAEQAGEGYIAIEPILRGLRWVWRKQIYIEQ
jgi:hypothetical protein